MALYLNPQKRSIMTILFPFLSKVESRSINEMISVSYLCFWVIVLSLDNLFWIWRYCGHTIYNFLIIFLGKKWKPHQCQWNVFAKNFRFLGVLRDSFQQMPTKNDVIQIPFLSRWIYNFKVFKKKRKAEIILGRRCNIVLCNSIPHGFFLKFIMKSPA